MTDQLEIISQKIDTIIARQEYISTNLAVFVERQTSTIKRLDEHLEDDKDLAEKVGGLLLRESKLAGKIAGFGLAGAVIGYFIDNGLKLMGKP